MINKRILVVDDEPDVIFTLKIVLEENASFMIKLTSNSSSTTRIRCFVKDIMMSIYIIHNSESLLLR